MKYLFGVLEIIISKLSYSLKIMFRNTFPEPQPDSASYAFGFICVRHHIMQIETILFCVVFCTKNALWFLVLLLWQIFSELFQGHWKHSGESQGTKGEFLATNNDHAPAGSYS